MKTGLFSSLVAATALQLVAARPFDQNNERDVVTVIQYVTATAPAAIVYVNQNGVPYATSTINQVIIQSAGAPSVATTAVAQHTLKVPEATGGSSHKGHHHGHSSSTPIKSHRNGLAYSPYNADGSCKSQAEVNQDFEQLDKYSMIRLYGVDCNGVTTVGNAAKAKGMKLFVGFYDLTDIGSEVQTLADGVNGALGGDWSMIDTVSIGNELVNSGAATVAEVVNAIGLARPLLQAAGYSGPVVTVDTFIAIINNPELCQASDYAAANAHGFFAGVPAAQAGSYAKEQQAAVQKACGGMKTVITESGWPSSGASNNLAVPSEANQQTAIASLQEALPGTQLILFTAYNDLWKTNNAYTFAAEQFWGIYGNSPSS